MASRGRRRASSYKWKKPDFMKNSRKSLILVIVLVFLFSSWFLYSSHKLRIQNAQSEEKIEYYQTLIDKEADRSVYGTSGLRRKEQGKAYNAPYKR